MRKRILSLLLTAALLCALCVTPALAAGATFPDAAQHWAISSINRWSEAGIAKGDPDGNVRPNDSLTRAEFATILVRLLGLRDNGVDYFTDVQTGDWYASAIRACAAAGIMNGFEDNTARPNQPITREEAMVMFGRAMGVTPASRPNLSKFTDGDRVSTWAAPYMAPLTDMGILSGMGDGTVLPRENINRASTFALLDKAIAAYITQPSSVTVNAPNGFVIINTPYEPSQTVTLSGHAAGVTVAPGDTSNLIFDGLSANTVKVDGPVAISLQARTDLGAVTLNVPATLDIARNTQVDSVAMNHDHSILNNKGEVGTVLANTAATITNAGTIDSLEADAAVQVKNNGVLKSVTARANNVILDGRAPQAMTVSAAVTTPPATSAGKTVTATGSTSSSSGGSGGGGGGGSTSSTSSVTFLPMDAELYATIGWDGIPALNDMQEDVTFTASGTTVRVGGTLKYVAGFTGFNPTKPEEQEGHYVALMFKVPASAVGTATVTMLKAESGEGDKVYTLTEDVLDTVGSDKVFASIYHVAADSKIQYRVDWDGSGSRYAATTYTLTFADATFESQAVPADVIAANLGQITEDSDLPANGLATGYKVVGTVDPADPTRVNVTIKADTLKSHANALGAEGYWIGFGMPNAEKKALTYLVAEGEGEASEVASIAGRFQEVDGKAYNTVYFTAEATPTTYTITVKDGETTVMTYVVTVDVALREGAAVEKDALDAAITAAEAIDKTGVVISTQNGADVPTTGKWVSKTVDDALTKALADAKTVNADETATQAAVNAATKALNAAAAKWIPAPGTKTEEPDPVQVDKTALDAAITAAAAAKAGVVTSADGTDVATNKQWVTDGQMSALNAAITAAEGVFNRDSATQDEVDKAVADLNDAVTTFNGQKQSGTKTDTPDPTPVEYDITVTAGEHGTATASAAKAAEGAEVTLTVTPDEGYVVDQITSDDVTVSNNKFTMPAKAVTINVTFKAEGGDTPDPTPTEYDVTVTAGEHGTATASAAKAAEGAEVTLTIAPDEGYVVDQITSDDVTVSNNKFTMPAKAVTINVTFKAEEPAPTTKYTITVTGGTVDGGLTEAEENAQVTVTADAPEAGKVFDKWVATGLTLTAEDEIKATLTFTMPAAAVTLTATYKDETVEPTPVTVTVTVVTTGLAEGATEKATLDGLTANEDGTYTVTLGEDNSATVTVVVPTVDGYKLVSVVVGADTVEPAESVYTVTVTADVTITVTYAVDNSALDEAVKLAYSELQSVQVSEDGAGLPAGTVWVPNSVKEAYRTAIEDAARVRDDPTATKEQMNDAKTALMAAAQEFSSRKTTVSDSPDIPTE